MNFFRTFRARQKAKQIRLVIFDVDGTFTNGCLYLGRDGLELKAFSVKDGQGVKLLLAAGIEGAIITLRHSKLVEERMQSLGIQHIFQGHDDKCIAYQQLLNTLNLKPNEVAYLGDDLPDLPVMEQVGLSGAPKDAVCAVRKKAHWVSRHPGGAGAVREFCELILKAQNRLHPYAVDTH